jgi:hypothetical protein
LDHSGDIKFKLTQRLLSKAYLKNGSDEQSLFEAGWRTICIQRSELSRQSELEYGFGDPALLALQMPHSVLRAKA